MQKKEDTPMRVTRRKYEERNKEFREKKTKTWGTNIDRELAEMIDSFLAEKNITKVALIFAGYEALKKQYEEKEKSNK